MLATELKKPLGRVVEPVVGIAAAGERTLIGLADELRAFERIGVEVTSAKFKTKYRRASQRLGMLPVVALIAERAVARTLRALDVQHRLLYRVVWKNCAVEPRAAERHQRPSAARKVAVARIRRVAPAAKMGWIVLAPVLRVENHLHCVRQRFVDARLSIAVYHSANFGQKQRRNRMGIHAPVALLSHVTLKGRVRTHVRTVENVVHTTVYRLAIGLASRQMAFRQERHARKRRNRGRIAVIPMERPVGALF